MGIARCLLVFAQYETFTLIGARQVGYIAGPLPDRHWGSRTPYDVIENGHRVTRAERILSSVLVILPHAGDAAWGGLPALKLLQYRRDTVSVCVSARALSCVGVITTVILLKRSLIVYVFNSMSTAFSREASSMKIAHGQMYECAQRNHLVALYRAGSALGIQKGTRERESYPPLH